ncbi:hypothetical protein BL250_08800 [Erwinia sp. OLTSP20]|nr:hypothetical protein BV501_10360 [Erwinia sp. OAMSP11]PIJ72459.1 hypothetical protein BK416_09435 [Erwinia sp. OLSSP12]PIJ80082.1 hypothetical protein BLD47_12005 [Erwinia sp. OLCASP19]PIJ82176.1 hypothetical protein BLD46_11730 [Erwinia sp. OLMTSP26]PIJ86412.1 hypothetical protein BLD49_08425 [Erwinia sp. OLMDSP33]PIJ89773.1 hypothetical protein BL249_15225 [Erwinia sp. OLFS4]PIJ92707.1 hypothetical protein BL250_08800 [Erwinia sp. OLTSP20]
MEMFKLGLRVYENKINKDADQMTLDQKLELIAHNVITSAFITEGIFGILKETADPSKIIKNAQFLDTEWPKAVQERVAGKLKNYFK